MVAWITLLLHPRVQILDCRFHILTAKISYGTKHTVFLGSQVEGRLRDWLRRVGFNVTPLRADETTTLTNDYACIIRYTGELPHEELCEVRAAFSDGAGTAIPLLWSTRASNPIRRDYLSVWVLESPLTNTAGCHLRLTQGKNGICLADIYLGKL